MKVIPGLIFQLLEPSMVEVESLVHTPPVERCSFEAILSSKRQNKQNINHHWWTSLSSQQGQTHPEHCLSCQRQACWRISALRDESDRTGCVVIELKDAFPDIVLNHLYKHTPLQSTFGVIMLSIVNNRPLFWLSKCWSISGSSQGCDHSKISIWASQSGARLHVLEGYLIALDNMTSSSVWFVLLQMRMKPTKIDGSFCPVWIQAQAILDMRLHRNRYGALENWRGAA